MKPIALYFKLLNYQKSNKDLLNHFFDVVEVDCPGDKLEENFYSDVEVLFAPLGFFVNSERIKKFPKLKAIISNTTGIPHIDALAAKERGIEICALHNDQKFLNTITPTAELTIGLIIAALRRIPASHFAAIKGHWNRRPWGAPRMMSRMRLGIVGYGRLGKKVATIARAMGMEVFWYDPWVSKGKGKIESLMALVKRSDILTLHAVSNQDTKGLIGKRELEALPNQAIVVNTARGEILDTEALIDLLENGHIWAAALDTIDGEYDINFCDRFVSSRLAKYARDHDNLILTPHIGGSTIDAWAETEFRVIEKACAVFGFKFI